MDLNDQLVNEGVEELLGMIDNSLDTLRNYGSPWNKLFESDTDDHMDLIYKYEKMVLVRVAQKLKEIHDV
jgi:hypothetical protein